MDTANLNLQLGIHLPRHDASYRCRHEHKLPKQHFQGGTRHISAAVAWPNGQGFHLGKTHCTQGRAIWWMLPTRKWRLKASPSSAQEGQGYHYGTSDPCAVVVMTLLLHQLLTKDDRVIGTATRVSATCGWPPPAAFRRIHGRPPHQAIRWPRPLREPPPMPTAPSGSLMWLGRHHRGSRCLLASNSPWLESGK